MTTTSTTPARTFCAHNNCPAAPVAYVENAGYVMDGGIHVRATGAVAVLLCAHHAPVAAARLA